MLLADFSGKVTVYTLDKADGAEAGAAFMSLQGSDPEQKTSKQAQVRDRLELRELTSYSGAALRSRTWRAATGFTTPM